MRTTLSGMLGTVLAIAGCGGGGTGGTDGGPPDALIDGGTVPVHVEQAFECVL